MGISIHDNTGEMQEKTHKVTIGFDRAVHRRRTGERDAPWLSRAGLAALSASGATIAPGSTDKGGAILLTAEGPTDRCIGCKMKAYCRVSRPAGAEACTEGGIRLHANTAAGVCGMFTRAVASGAHQVGAKQMRREASRYESHPAEVVGRRLFLHWRFEPVI